MIDKLDGMVLPCASVRRTGNSGLPDNNGLALGPLTRLSPVGEAKRVSLFCGTLLAAMFAWDVCAETEATTGVIPIDQTVVISVSPEVNAASNMADDQNEQPLLVRQARLDIANPQNNHLKQLAVLENSVQGGGESTEGQTGVPYAIMLAMVALIGLVPVARRNGGL